MTALIGIPGRRRKGADFTHGLDIYAESDFDVYFADYARAIVEAGGLPVHLTVEADPGRLADRLDGLVLPGGPDIDPRRYGHPPGESVFVDRVRDDFELALVGATLAAGKPILGICRGLQILNVHFGGTLVQHVAAHGVFDEPANHHAHVVSLDPGSTIGRLMGDRLQVNSLHHQAVEVLGTELRAVGWAEDGVIEAVESREHRAVAVQWHAEKLDTRSTDPLFAWLVAEATGPGQR